jgi:uncharacterized protein YegL
VTTPAGAKLLPFYLVVDVSWSMAGDKLEQANKIIPSVVDALARNPILSDKVRFAVIDFSDDAQIRLPLCDLLDDDLTLPSLAVRGTTSYSAAFRLLRSEIETNVKQLKADGFSVHRPAVFFLSDGLPSEDDSVWQAAFADLTGWDSATKQGFREFPNVIPCGVDGAEPGVMQGLIHPPTGDKRMQMYMMEPGGDPALAIKAIAEILISSVLASGQSMARGESGIVLPDKAQLPQGVAAYTADDDDFL